MPSRIDHHDQLELSKAQVLLKKYDVSENGFLPEGIPLDRLPHPLYAPWEDILSQLPTLLKRQTIRRSIDNLDVISIQKLDTEGEWRRAYVVLSFLAHGYIWGGDKPSEILPAAISVPYVQVSEHLELPPVATYAALNLWNFTSSRNDFTDLNSLKALHTFSGTEDESWFFCLSVAMECQGAYIIPIMLDAIEGIQRKDYQTVADNLDTLRECIEKLSRLLERMHERCDPMVFYHQIRPYLAGSRNMEHAGLPNGVFYEEGDGKGSWRQLRGGSNGQSSLIQFFDVVLGVEHNSSGNAGQQSRDASTGRDGKPVGFHEEVRSYMPEPHRRFLQHVSRMDSLRDFALRSAVSDEQRRVRQSFQAATTALAEFRSKHMQMVTRYIIVPSRRQVETESVNLAAASTRASSGKVRGAGLTGTGGTALIPFLRQTRDETLQAGMSPSNSVIDEWQITT
ncbi:hypothetical protein DL766_007958 [Monosporascus sp. MC13-8B]|uniref:Indoleamine 2,3-dioxygenase n=1 Tax=Monosporascus cannonballus TaxID=155416 RepID=A0ABY0HKJ4_9PEZI|nr:hypothetical protein DL762_000430 [Monosporascus cannonballus]RYP01133.1 hypothetical protein DL763_000370 [Monosporascus cannonballus]RYP21308.1 hypothetical protein DL766_007958 [Monosporascus sp. MC13-8B]